MTLDTYAHLFERARHSAQIRSELATSEFGMLLTEIHWDGPAPKPATVDRRREGGYAGTSWRTGLSSGPCSNPITNRISSAAASLCSVCTEVLCWPLSIREIAE